MGHHAAAWPKVAGGIVGSDGASATIGMTAVRNGDDVWCLSSAVSTCPTHRRLWNR
jgi:hypothetical protein